MIISYAAAPIAQPKISHERPTCNQKAAASWNKETRLEHSPRCLSWHLTYLTFSTLIQRSISCPLTVSDLDYIFPGVSPPFLNAFYKIQSNKGNKSMSQAVFETSGEKFSPGDLKNFQISNSIPRQAAVDRKGISSTETCLSVAHPDSSNPDCNEGNLDLQFLMGIAQRTTTVYWYESSGNPFLSWITSMANTPHPPTSSSISWGTIEQVGCQHHSLGTPYILSVDIHSVWGFRTWDISFQYFIMVTFITSFFI